MGEDDLPIASRACRPPGGCLIGRLIGRLHGLRSEERQRRGTPRSLAVLCCVSIIIIFNICFVRPRCLDRRVRVMTVAARLVC